MFQVPGRRADSLRIGLYTNFLDTTCVKRLACVNLFSLQQKIAPFSVEDGAIRLFDLCSQAYAKRATSSWSTSVILTSELTGTNSLTPW